MATGKITTATDGQLAYKVGRWAKDKLFYIERYCELFNTAMKRKWQVRSYVDLFAGPGICILGSRRTEFKGSPLIALDCDVPFTHYYFNDVNPAVINALMVRSGKYTSVQIDYSCKDCNVVIDELLKKMPQGSLDFCFIDPFKWEIEFDSIQKLTKERRMDLAITFHIGNIRRVADSPLKELDNFFPDTSWRQEYAEAVGKRAPTGRVLLDAYERGLKSLGYQDIKDYVLEVNTKNVPLYYLIFASKHPLGADFWDKIAGQSEAGQLRMQISHS